MNISGYIFYGLYSTIGYFTDVPGAGTVVLADILFVYHALFMVFILTVQASIYPRGKNRVSGYTIVLCMMLWLGIML